MPRRAPCWVGRWYSPVLGHWFLDYDGIMVEDYMDIYIEEYGIIWDIMGLYWIIVWKLMKYWNCMEDYMGLNIWDYTLTSYPLLTHLHHKSIGSFFMSNHLDPGLNWLKSLKHQTTNQFSPRHIINPNHMDASILQIYTLLYPLVI